MSEELDGLLDEKLERLVSLLDEKWRLKRHGDRGCRDADKVSPESSAERPRTSSATSGSG